MDLREERQWWKRGFGAVAGVDEAGRGPLAGPVIAAAVIFDSKKNNAPLARQLRDSKKLSPKQRETLFASITTACLCYSYAFVSHRVIDQIGILRATKLAMRSAIRKLTTVPQILLIDAVSINICDIPQKALIHGDDRIASIAAASIVAKVVRDRLMDRYARRFAQYSFQTHKGYGTTVHIEELSKNGPSLIHRRSFAPVKNVLDKRIVR